MTHNPSCPLFDFIFRLQLLGCTLLAPSLSRCRNRESDDASILGSRRGAKESRIGRLIVVTTTVTASPSMSFLTQAPINLDHCIFVLYDGIGREWPLPPSSVPWLGYDGSFPDPESYLPTQVATIGRFILYQGTVVLPPSYTGLPTVLQCTNTSINAERVSYLRRSQILDRPYLGGDTNTDANNSRPSHLSLSSLDSRVSRPSSPAHTAFLLLRHAFNNGVVAFDQLDLEAYSSTACKLGCRLEEYERIYWALRLSTLWLRLQNDGELFA
ncbi:hypothetical protein GALMADRAFT_145878 [Galerina marginata CBS 339.88]|uniref:Uncharacterized protein n=1 Tax=Galerina marginata (strain CBS 339.88) TaxID=685588 RepID=A0A067SMA9_GALM3|nr:hypothetical protein GALMADRAFT_145878 [Galerina marginata CBS 339.88]